MKRCCIIILLLMLILPGKSYAQPDTDGEILGTQEQMKLGVQQQVDHLDMRDWDRFLKELEEQQNPVLKQMSAKEILKKLVTGDYNIDLKQFWIYLGGIFYKEILNNLGWVTKIIVMAVICGVLKNMQASLLDL
jgi:stage III sporulation protein AE